MAGLLDIPPKLLSALYTCIQSIPLPLVIIAVVLLLLWDALVIFLALLYFAPKPRLPFPSEVTYITTNPDDSRSSPRLLPCWHDAWVHHRREMDEAGDLSDSSIGVIDDAEIAMSVVVPAYNEEARLEEMLEEAVAYLDSKFGRPPKAIEIERGITTAFSNGVTINNNTQRRGPNGIDGLKGYEIILVNDGSKDKTVDVALNFSKKHRLHDILRIVTLTRNRGKGGAVTHGFRHVRGAHAVFADADGASRFSDLGKLVDGCNKVADTPKRGVAIGSRAHLVGSEAVVKRSALRNTLMHGFHGVLRILTPPATSRIRDTQCGFKLFSRTALPHIIPYMHAEGWIFDVEMLMLAESAPPGIVADEDGNALGTTPGIRVAEVPIGWKEVGGSKLNVIWDSLGMAWGLLLLRASWALGVYRRR